MQKIYSKVDSNKLLHIVNRIDDTIQERTDIAPENQFLQASILKVNQDKTYKPHKHKWKTPSYQHTIAQESWVILQGSVEVYYYDIDDKLIETVIIHAGDCSMTFEGGHSYKILEDNSIIYEFKTGPYLGQQKDKTFIEDL